MDVGDRVLIGPTSSEPHGGALVVAEITALCTRFVLWNGESRVIMNVELRKLSVVNLHRSTAPIERMTVRVPADTPPRKLLSLLQCAAAYANAMPVDWSEGSADITTIDHVANTISLRLSLTSGYKAFEQAKIALAVTKLHIFVHSYMRAARIAWQ